MKPHHYLLFQVLIAPALAESLQRKSEFPLALLIVYILPFDFRGAVKRVAHLSSHDEGKPWFLHRAIGRSFAISIALVFFDFVYFRLLIDCLYCSQFQFRCLLVFR